MASPYAPVNLFGKKRKLSEAKTRHVSSSVVCTDMDKEGSNNYEHKESGNRVPNLIGLQEINDILAPQWTEKRYYNIGKIAIPPNCENIQEYCLMDRNFVWQRMRKSVGINPIQLLLTQSVPGGTLSGVAQDVTQQVRYEGGKYTFNIMNTCNNTLYFEFRQYKIDPNLGNTGAIASNRSPLICFQTDQQNTHDFGDLPYPAATAGAVEGGLPSNTNRLSDWSVTNAGEVASADSNVNAQLSNSGYINSALLPAFKRPQRSSPQLHKAYNQVQVLKVTLKPGDTFVYEVRINPFIINGADQFVNSSGVIQYYSRVVHMYCRAEFNASNLVGQSGLMATGPGSYIVNGSYIHNWRAVPKMKKNIFIESSATAGELGPYSDININNNISTEQQLPTVAMSAQQIM